MSNVIPISSGSSEDDNARAGSDKPFVKPELETSSPSESNNASIEDQGAKAVKEKKDKKKTKKKDHKTKRSKATISISETDGSENDYETQKSNYNMNYEAANQPEVLFETKRVPKLRVETEGKVLMRIYLVDDSFKTVFINPETTTIEDIWTIVCEKLQLPPNEWSCFFLFGVSPNLDILMYSDSTVSSLLSEWPLLEAQFAYQQSLSSSVRQTLAFTSLRKPSQTSKVEYTTFQELPTKQGASSSSTLSSSSSSLNMMALNRGVNTSSRSTLSKLTRTISMSSRTMTSTMESPRNQGHVSMNSDSSMTASMYSTAPTSTSSTTTYSSSSSSSSSSQDNYFKLMLKPTTILPLQEEANVTSPGGINLFYMQAVYDTIESHYPTTVEDALVLAGMQMYVTNGPYDPAVHKPGFLAPNLENFVPHHIFVREKVKKYASLWEAKIYSEQKKMGVRDKVEVMNMYLTHARTWPCYGATFFNVVHNPPNMGFYRQKGLGDVVLGINRLGLHIIDAKEMGSRSTPVVFYKWEEITSWDSDEETFFFEYIRPGMEEPVTISFDTSQGDYINDLMHDWMEEIKSAIVKTNQYLFAQSTQEEETFQNDGGEEKKKKKKKKKKHHHEE